MEDSYANTCNFPYRYIREGFAVLLSEFLESPGGIENPTDLSLTTNLEYISILLFSFRATKSL